MNNRGTVVSIAQGRVPVNEKLLSVKETAAQLGVSESFVYQSDVPYVKLNRRRLYRPSDLARYVNARVSHHVGLDDV